MGLATFAFIKWPVPWDWPFSKGVDTGLKYAVMGSGQSHGTGHFLFKKSGQSHGTGHFKGSQDRLKGEAIGSGQSHGTGHF